MDVRLRRRTVHHGTSAGVDGVEDYDTSCEEGDQRFRCEVRISLLMLGLARFDIHILPGNFLGRKPGILTGCIGSGLCLFRVEFGMLWLRCSCDRAFEVSVSLTRDEMSLVVQPQSKQDKRDYSTVLPRLESSKYIQDRPLVHLLN